MVDAHGERVAELFLESPPPGVSSGPKETVIRQATLRA
jgi:hypothetical protein